jgi:hypothetical protein
VDYAFLFVFNGGNISVDPLKQKEKACTQNDPLRALRDLRALRVETCSDERPPHQRER